MLKIEVVNSSVSLSKKKRMVNACTESSWSYLFGCVAVCCVREGKLHIVVFFSFSLLLYVREGNSMLLFLFFFFLLLFSYSSSVVIFCTGRGCVASHFSDIFFWLSLFSV